MTTADVLIAASLAVLAVTLHAVLAVRAANRRRDEAERALSAAREIERMADLLEQRRRELVETLAEDPEQDADLLETLQHNASDARPASRRASRDSRAVETDVAGL